MTHYVSEGSGRTVIILHGWGDNVVGWVQFIDKLAKQYRVVALDLPGFGKTQAPKTAWGLDEYASFVAAFVQKTELEPWAIVGHSNGGAIALRGLGSGKLHTERLVLLASAGIRNEHMGRSKVLGVFTKLGKLIMSPLPQTTKKKIQQKVYTLVGSDMLVAENLQETFKKIIVDDVRSDAKNIKIPTLLVYGQDDTSTPARYGKILHGLLADSRLDILPQAGHFVHLDQPDKTLEMMKDFLQ